MKSFLLFLILILFNCSFFESRDLESTEPAIPKWAEGYFQGQIMREEKSYKDRYHCFSYHYLFYKNGDEIIGRHGKFSFEENYSIASGVAIGILEELRPEIRDRINWQKLAHYMEKNLGDSAWRISVSTIISEFSKDDMDWYDIRLPRKPESSLWNFADQERPDLSKGTWYSLNEIFAGQIKSNEDFYRIGLWKIINLETGLVYSIEVREDARVVTFKLN